LQWTDEGNGVSFEDHSFCDIMSTIHDITFQPQMSNESDIFFPYSGFGHHRTLSESSASSTGADFKMPVKKNNEEDVRNVVIQNDFSIN
jgi:hypothetical protein